MVATRTKDRQAAQTSPEAMAATVARADRRKRATAGTKSWKIAETIPGTFRVLTSSGGDYAVWYYLETDTWSCSCPDSSEAFGAAHRFGIECKHIFGVQARDDLVDPETEIPLSLMGQAMGEDTLPQTSHLLTLSVTDTVRRHTCSTCAHEEDMNMTSSAFIRGIAEALAAPFPVMVHAFKPGATSRDGKTALALTYVDSRLYQSRLDKVDPAWQSEYQVIALNDRILVNCRLTVCDVTREDVGECSLFTTSRGETVPEENAYTSAVAQSFKRVCAQFGLGRYLYELPKLWADYDQQKRCFTSNGLSKLRKALIKSIGEANTAGIAQTGPPVPTPESPTNGKASAEQKGAIGQMLTVLGYRDQAAQEGALAQAGLSSLDALTIEQANQAIARLEAATQKATQAHEATVADNGRS